MRKRAYSSVLRSLGYIGNSDEALFESLVYARLSSEGLGRGRGRRRRGRRQGRPPPEREAVASASASAEPISLAFLPAAANAFNE